jgi:hypothetical protein
MSSFISFSANLMKTIRTMDGETDVHFDSSTPPNFVARGIINWPLGSREEY